MSDVTIPRKGKATGRVALHQSAAPLLPTTQDGSAASNVLSWERGRLRQALPLLVSRCMAFSAMTRFDDDLIAAVREFYGLELDVATAEAEILEDEDERIRFFPWFLWDWRMEAGLPSIAERFADEADHDRYEARLLDALCNSYVGFYEALEDAGPRGVTLKDLLTGETLFVPDEGLEGDLFANNVLQARLLRIPTENDSASVLIDAVYACLPPEARPAVAAELATLAEPEQQPLETSTARVTDARQRSQECSRIDRVRALTPELLHFGDQLMENLARPPQANNGDGDPLVLCSAKIRLSKLGEDFDASKLANAEALEMVEPKGHLATQLGDRRLLRYHRDGAVRGWLEIRGGSLTLAANSTHRLTQLETAVGEILGQPLPRSMRVLEDFHTAVQRWAESGGGSRWLAADPDVQRATSDWLQAWARHWIDMPSATLGDKTPREAVRDTAGRKRVEVMLERFETLTRGHLAMVAEDQVTTLRTQLGLTS